MDDIFDKVRHRIKSSAQLTQTVRQTIRKAAHFFGIDLLLLAHNDMGILNFRNPDESGERHLITVWLQRFLEHNGVADPLFLDIGANEGNYARMLLSEYPDVRLFAFEPNPRAVETCQEALASYQHAEVRDVGMGAEPSQMELHIPANPEKSLHASLYSEVLGEQHAYSDFRSHKVDIHAVDDVLDADQTVHFAKIDTEGHEFDVLKGAARKIDAGDVWSIQFEFNEMNVVSRVFLRDYFEFLSDYNLYRLLPNRLDPLTYNPRQEIFKFQNILAVHTSKDIPLDDR